MVSGVVLAIFGRTRSRAYARSARTHRHVVLCPAKRVGDQRSLLLASIEGQAGLP